MGKVARIRLWVGDCVKFAILGKSASGTYEYRMKQGSCFRCACFLQVSDRASSIDSMMFVSEIFNEGQNVTSTVVVIVLSEDTLRARLGCPFASLTLLVEMGSSLRMSARSTDCMGGCMYAWLCMRVLFRIFECV